MSKTDILRRSFAISDLEVRSVGKTPKIEGYAACYGAPSRDLGGWREILRRGCFTGTLAAGAKNVSCLFNHNADLVLGTVRGGTLKLEDRDKGLWFEVSPPDTQAGRDVVELMRRKDIGECSFAFQIQQQEWRTDKKQGEIREIIAGELFDVSVVTLAAFPQPSAHLARSILTRDFGVDLDGLALAMQRAKAGQPTDKDLQVITQFQNSLVSLNTHAGRLERILQGKAVAGTMPRTAALVGAK